MKKLIERFETDGLDSVSIFFAGQSLEAGNQSRAFFQAVFQNEYSALIEVWQVTYRLEASAPIITDKRRPEQFEALSLALSGEG